MRRPPVFASLLLRGLLPADAYECVAGDLEEAWQSGSLSRAGFFRLALASIVECRRPRLSRAPVHHDLNQKRGDSLMRTILQDFTYGARLMRRNPGFTAAAVATLALGIGANTALFSIINVLTIQPLAYREPDRVVFVRAWSNRTQTAGFSLSILDFVEISRRSTTLEHVTTYSYWSANLTGGSTPERAQAYRVTANTFDMLGVPPTLGRTFLNEEGLPGGRRVVVLSHGLWQRRFGSDPSIVGRDITLDGHPHSIVGVMPASFEFPVYNFKGELWVPWQLDPQAILADRASASSSVVVARIRPNVTHAAAQAEIDAIMRRLEAEHPDTNGGRGARLTEMGRLDDESAGPGILIVAATATLVLLLACANVANLLLARGVSRQRELAVRAALGAGRARLVVQLMSEGVLLAIAGGAAGLFIAYLALNALYASLPEMVMTTQPNIDALGIDSMTLTYAAGTSLLTSLIFGVIPAFRAASPMLQDGLKEGAASGGGRGTRRLRAALVIAEVSLSTIMLVSAGLLVRSYQRQQHINPGFDPEGVLTMMIALPEYRYSAPEARTQFFQESVQRISSLAGVESAAFVNVLPFSTYNRGGVFTVDGRADFEKGREPSADFRVVTDEYFSTMRIPLRAGRGFDTRDAATGARVAIVNEALVRRHFKDQDPLGQRLKLGRIGGAGAVVTVVGIAGDVHHNQLVEPPTPEIYFPLAQSPAEMMMLAARTAGDPQSFSAAIRSEILAVDPAQPVYHVKPMTTLLGDSLAAPSFSASLMSLFSGLALMLAAIGIYGVVSYAVNQQRREFGVRLALGARPRDLLTLVLRRGLLLVATGVAIGTICGLGVGRALANMLYDVGPADPVTFVSVTAMLAAVGLAACCIPALRASRTEPVTALRD
jgi:putative ABC transport system permease protein